VQSYFALSAGELRAGWSNKTEISIVVANVASTLIETRG
jgi:hypothetical protein